VLASPEQLVEAAAPKLSRDEELYALSLKDLVKGTAGEDVASVVSGDALSEPQAAARLALSVLVSGQAPGLDNSAVRSLAANLRDQLLPASQAERETAEAGLNDLVAFVSEELTPAESTALTEFADHVILASWHQVASRLEPLFPAGVAVTALPAREKPSARRQMAAAAAEVSSGDLPLVTPVVEEVAATAAV